MTCTLSAVVGCGAEDSQVGSAGAQGANPSLGAAVVDAPAQPAVLAQLRGALAQDSRLAALLAPNPEAISAGAEGFVSQAARGQIKRGLGGVAAWLPQSANGALEVGIGRSQRLRLRLTDPRGNNAAAQLSQGRAVYADSHPATDTVVLSGKASLEVLWVLRDASAPETFTWQVEFGADLAEPTADGHGGLVWRDSLQQPVLRTPAPYAIDADGGRHAANLQWDAQARALRVSLEHRGLAHPVALDPSFDAFPRWTNVTPSGVSPDQRSGAAMGYDPVRKQMLLFGGYACDKTRTCSLRNDTWQWNGSTWTQLADTSASVRTHTAMTYDPVLGGLYQMGGDYITTASDETRLWNGSSWQLVDRTPVPPFSRSGVGLAYEPGSPGRMLAFGGDEISTTIFNTQTTVRPDGAFWTGPSWPNQPPGRRDGKLLYDPVGAKTYLFGGRPCHITDSCQQQDDYWELSGTTWTNLGVGARAPARSGFGFVYDSARQVGMLFGGRSDSATLRDLWEVKFPDTWEEIGSLPSGPPARAYHAMAYDSDREVVVLFGGVADMSNPSNTTALADDTWELSVVDLTCTTAAQCASGNCVDGVCCDVAQCGVCETCGDPSTPGTCTPVLSADDPDSCSVSCDASGNCSAPFDCTTDADCGGPCERCDAQVCVPRAGEAEPLCGSFLCGSGADCPESCGGDGDCASGYRCENTECVDFGNACTSGAECLSGACVDGVCCDQACDVCGVCSVSAGADVDGMCKPLPAGTQDPACELACDGEGRCAEAGLGDGAACNEHRECASGSCVEHTCCGASPRSCVKVRTTNGPTAFDPSAPGTGCSCSLPGARAWRTGSQPKDPRDTGLSGVVLLLAASLAARRRRVAARRRASEGQR